MSKDLTAMLNKQLLNIDHQLKMHETSIQKLKKDKEKIILMLDAEKGVKNDKIDNKN